MVGQGGYRCWDYSTDLTQCQIAVTHRTGAGLRSRPYARNRCYGSTKFTVGSLGAYRYL